MSATTEVLIPHHRGASTLRRTLESLRRQSVPTDVCVVDNGSDDGSREMLATEFAEVRIVEMGANRGFGAALNAGVRTSRAELVIFLNDDAEADERFAQELSAACGQTGCAAGVLRLENGAVDSAGVQVDRSLVAYDHLHGEPWAAVASASSPLGPCGGAAAFERRAFLELGGFDEGFFAYLEDVDLAIRLRLAGLGCALAPGAFAWHRHAGSLGSGSAAKNRLLGRGRERLLWKYGSSLTVRDRLRGVVVDGVTYAGQIVVDRNAAALRGRLEERRRHRGEPRPIPSFELGELAPLEVGLVDSLRRRWARGRRYRGSERPA